MNNDNVDKIYDNFLNVIDEVTDKYNNLKPGEQLSDADINKVKNVLKTARDVSNDNNVLLSPEDVKIPDDIPDVEKEAVNSTYSMESGITVSTGESPSKMKGDLDTEFNIDNDEYTMNLLNEHFGEIEDLDKVAIIINRINNGEDFNIYEELPSSMKLIIDNEAAKYPDYRMVRNMIAKSVIYELSKEVKNNAGMDLDDFLSDIKKDIKEYSDEISKETAKFAVDMMKENKDIISKALEDAVEKKDEDKINKLNSINTGLIDAESLSDFIDFCKKVKIKKFDLEKPKRYYNDFNNKYENHKYNIYDVSACVNILDRHFEDNHNKNLALIIAFCKYCMNYSPNNLYEHTFMYYFIKNIIMLDRLKPRGLTFVDDNKEYKDLYNNIYSKLNKCMENIRI